jgi:IS5 family transposase
MNKQLSMSRYADESGWAATGKKEFLRRMDAVILQSGWTAIIKPRYYKGERSNKPFDQELTLRIRLFQNLYGLSYMGVMNEVIGSREFSGFCRADSSGQVPKGDTTGRFRALLFKHGLREKFFRRAVKMPEDSGLILKKGAIVDSAVISSPSSAKNR